MDLPTILSYVNRVSLLFFFVTLLILIYQIYLLKKDLSSHQEEKINIPDFDDNLHIKITNYTRLPDYLLESVKKPVLKNNQRSILNIVIVGSLVVFTFIIFLIAKNKTDNLSKNQQRSISPTSAEKSTEVTQYDIPTPTAIRLTIFSPTEDILPTLSASPTESISPTEIVIATPTMIIEEVVNESEPPTVTNINTATQIDNLPITASFNKTFFFLLISLTFILLAFSF